jgi:hypothetical protein
VLINISRKYFGQSTVFLLYAYFWVITRPLDFKCRRFGTLHLFYLHRQVDVSTTTTQIYLPMEMEQTECSETSAFKLQTPDNYPKESTQHNIYLQAYVCYYVAHKTIGSNVILITDTCYTYICNKNRSIVTFKGKTLFTCMRFTHY